MELQKWDYLFQGAWRKDNFLLQIKYFSFRFTRYTKRIE